MTVHLHLAQLPVPSALPMLTATTPEAAITLLRTGVVKRLSVSENWSSTCDPEHLVAEFFKQSIHAGDVSLPEWKEESLLDLMLSPEAIATQEAEHLHRFNEYLITHYPELSPDWTFDNFTPVPGSEIAYAYAALASLERRSERNPLFILGPQGSGKSHLLHAIGRQWARFNTNTGGKMLVLTAESFTANDSAAEKIAMLTEADCFLMDGLEKLTAPALASFAQLTDKLISKGPPGMVFTWRGTQQEVDREAHSGFFKHPHLCMAGLTGKAT